MATATARSRALAAAGPSLTRQTDATLRDVNQVGTDAADQCVVWGTAASAPTTFGDLANTGSATLSSLDYAYDHASGHYRTITVLDIDPTGTVGLHLWVGYVGTTASPISGTVLDFVADCGPLIA